MHGGDASGNCYCGGNGMSKKYSFPSNDPNGPDVTTFHTYGAIWSPNMVQFYVDNPANIFFVRTTNDVPAGFSWDFNHPFLLLLNLAVGGTGSWPGPPDTTTPSPAVMLVDYVRVYTASAMTALTMTAPSMSVTAGQSASSTITLNSEGRRRDQLFGSPGPVHRRFQARPRMLPPV
jgi:beta-glucanase (GH16 family)